MTRPDLAPLVEALHRALREQSLSDENLDVQGSETELTTYVKGIVNLAPLVEAVLAAQWRPDASARPIAAAVERVRYARAGTRSIADHIAFGLYYWTAAGEERNALTELALAEATVAALKEYLLRQPMERTAQQMLDDFYPPPKEAPDKT